MENIDTLVEKYFENAVKDLQELIKINSENDKSTSSNEQPFGKGIALCLNQFLNTASKDGFINKNIDNYAGYAECGTGDLIGILAHLDVVPAGNHHKWTYPPYAAEIHNNKMYGRGTADDKGPLMAAYTALKILKENYTLNKRFRVIAGCDEETSMRCLKRYKETEEIPVFSFSPDASFPAVNGEKGQMQIALTRDFIHQGLEPIKLLGLTCGEVINIVPEEAYAYFSGNIAKLKRQLEEIAGDDLEIDYFEEKYLRVKAYGKAMHSMHAPDGVNGMYKLFKYLAHPDLDYGPWELMHWIRSMALIFDDKNISKNLGVNYSDEFGELTINLGLLRYKSKDLQLHFDIRYPVTMKPSKFESKLHLITEKIMMLGQIKKHIPPLYISEDNKYLKELLKAYKDVANEDAKPVTIGGRTYCAAMPNSVSFGAKYPQDEELAHQVDEYVDLDKFKKNIKIYLQALINLNNM